MSPDGHAQTVLCRISKGFTLSPLDERSTSHVVNTAKFVFSLKSNRTPPRRPLVVRSIHSSSRHVSSPPTSFASLISSPWTVPFFHKRTWSGPRPTFANPTKLAPYSIVGCCDSDFHHENAAGRTGVSLGLWLTFRCRRCRNAFRSSHVPASSSALFEISSFVKPGNTRANLRQSNCPSASP